MYDGFEWDGAGDRANVEAHGVDLETAAAVFEGPVLARPDDRAALGERRFIGIGAVCGVELTIVFTVRSPRLCRILSARRAHGIERQTYHQALTRRAAGRPGAVTGRCGRDDRTILAESHANSASAPVQDAETWRGAELIEPEQTVQVTLRIQRETLRTFQNDGPGAEQRMAQVLDKFARRGEF